ncbi:hypothetical protein LY54_00549 [Salegentibacter mishustinae]|nr:hypothetical protein LY54_00549 [Salegentibacter mishustinae]
MFDKIIIVSIIEKSRKDEKISQPKKQWNNIITNLYLSCLHLFY